MASAGGNTKAGLVWQCPDCRFYTEGAVAAATHAHNDPVLRPRPDEPVSWTSEWPKEKGVYWFFGKAFSSEEGKKLFFVEVRHGADASPFYVTNGHFLYKFADGAEGVWKKAELPALPEEEP